MSIDNIILLPKIVFKRILFYALPVWSSAAIKNIKKIQTLQNNLLRSSFKYPFYLRNWTIDDSHKIEPIRKSFKNLAERFYSNIYSIRNPKIFNLPDYSPRHYYKRLKASSFILLGINYKKFLSHQSYSQPLLRRADCIWSLPLSPLTFLIFNLS